MTTSIVIEMKIVTETEIEIAMKQKEMKVVIATLRRKSSVSDATKNISTIKSIALTRISSAIIVIEKIIRQSTALTKMKINMRSLRRRMIIKTKISNLLKHISTLSTFQLNQSMRTSHSMRTSSFSSSKSKSISLLFSYASSII